MSVQREKGQVRIWCCIRLQDLWTAVYFWKFEKEMATGDKDKLFILFISFVYSHSTKHDCVLPVAKAKSVL